ncbi:MAG TPA: exodeoxyribonuclease VII small subunit [Vicinamibacteria bacterium]|nr:exodeoxyribonuclease VII small subunit [Vicinamibacteria bacterium]
MTLKPKDFESALKKLEEIVKELEEGELTLEKSLERYEEGVALARFCNAKLNEAEARIEMLQKTESGEPSTDAEGKVRQTPLDFDENES